MNKIIPTLKYQNAKQAIDWLCGAFGFKAHMIVETDDGLIAHAQLMFSGNMVMLSSAMGSVFDELQQPPEQLTSPGSQSCYIVIENVDQHCDVARSQGATIVMEPVDQDYGGRGYTCRDLEGHIWSFGSYDPFAEI